MPDATSPKRAADDAETQLQPMKDQIPVCSSCGKSDVKYRCPRCERITCSLHCCVEHKKQFNCNGKRDRTKFVQLKEFTDADLSSDYFFLEEVSRSTNSAARSQSQLNAVAHRFTSNKKRKVEKGRHNTTSSLKSVNPDIPADWLMRFPVPVQQIAQHSAKRGVALTLLAPGMSKRTRNSSYMDIRTNTLHWRVEWVFPSSEVPVNFVEARVDEKVTPFALLEKYFTPTQENVAVRGKLKKYAVQDWKQNILLLLRKEFISASQPQYYRLNGNESLECNLKRKAIVEFPVITVALVADAEQYPIAHDFIEVVSLDANDQQHPTKEPEAASEGKNDKKPSELLINERTTMSEAILLSPEKKNECFQTSPQPQGLLIEEAQVPQPDKLLIEEAQVPQPDGLLIEEAQVPQVPQPDSLLIEEAQVPQPDGLLIQEAQVPQSDSLLVEEAQMPQPKGLLVEEAQKPQTKVLLVEEAQVPQLIS